jgi:integrase
LNASLGPWLERPEFFVTSGLIVAAHALQTKSPKTVNNVLAVLSVLLKKAVEWEVIERMPCTVKLLPVSKGSAPFYDFDQYERLIEVARTLDARTHLVVLLGGEAGLRVGEMMALEWGDVDLVNRQVCVARSDWNGIVTSPKGGRLRRVPLTRRLAAALSAQRHLRSARVLCQDDGTPLTRPFVQAKMKRASRRAGMTHDGLHILRHSFCSHLAMRGAPARAIQELAGHAAWNVRQNRQGRLLDVDASRGGPAGRLGMGCQWRREVRDPRFCRHLLQRLARRRGALHR